MGFLSNLFQKSPQKRGLVAIGGYEAATFTRDRSTIYTPSLEQQTNPTTFTRNEIVRMTRYLVNNYPLAERILTVSEIYGVGAGLYANAATKDSDFNDLNTHLFDQWGNSVFCSSNNQYNLYEIQKLIVRELLIAGEVFIVLIKAQRGYPQLMLVPTENVRHSGDASDDSQDGLYVDDYGKVTAFNVYTGKVYQKVDASNVVHLMRHKQIGQLRGVGGFAASLNAMRDHKDCMVLEKKAVKVHSTLAAVVERAAGEAGPSSGLFGDMVPIDSLGAPTAAATNIGLERAFPGAVAYVEKGEKVNLISSERSTRGFMSFLEMLIRDVCLNISIPYEFLVNSEKLTGTGVRFALSDAAFFFQNLQNILIDGAMQRIYSWVTASLINDGKIDAPTNDLPWNVTFTRPISITVDLQRTSNVEISLLQNSLLTYESYYSARGKDWKAELRQHAKEEKFLDDLSRETGVSVGRLRAIQGGSPAPAPTEEDTTAPEEQKKAA